MSHYAAPQRAPRTQRSLSCRARIIAVAGLLLPVSLLTVALTPISASASKPIYATLQDVQDAINSALPPINSAIAKLQAQQANQASQLSSQQSAINNLQSTQATHTSQISDLQTQQTNQAQAINYLQNSAAKQLKVYDANGQELGIAIDHAGSQDTIFSTTLKRFIYLYFTSYSVDGDFANVTQTLYQSSDCTGTAYMLADDVTNGSKNNNLIPGGSQHFYIIPDSETPTTASIHSVQVWNPNNNQISCYPNNTGTTEAYALQQINLPFSTSLALPLQFKYQ